MPFKSKSQKRFLEAVAHNKDFANKVGVSQKVGKEFDKTSKEEHQDYSQLPERFSKLKDKLKRK